MGRWGWAHKESDTKARVLLSQQSCCLCALGTGRGSFYFTGTFFNLLLNLEGFGVSVPWSSREWEKGPGQKWRDKTEEPHIFRALGTVLCRAGLQTPLPSPLFHRLQFQASQPPPLVPRLPLPLLLVAFPWTGQPIAGS